VLRGDEPEVTDDVEDISVREARPCATKWPEIFGGTRQRNKGGNGPAQGYDYGKKCPPLFKGSQITNISK
jgi:hypothetical protein